MSIHPSPKASLSGSSLQAKKTYFAFGTDSRSAKTLFFLALGCAAMLPGGKAQAQTPTFAPREVNPDGLSRVFFRSCPTYADLDGDGDLDLYSGNGLDTLKYFENQGSATAPAFVQGPDNPFGFVAPVATDFSPAFADMDGDGDLDLWVADDRTPLLYYENTGTATTPQFAAGVVTPFGIQLTPGAAYFRLAAADLDNDGDTDLLLGNAFGGFNYLENTGTSAAPTMGTATINPFGLSIFPYYAAPALADLDGDGDLDLLVGGSYGIINYHQNTGSVTNPTFASRIADPFGIDPSPSYSTVALADLDGDGDQDLTIGAFSGDFIYQENLAIQVGIDEGFFTRELEVYPQPASGKMYFSGTFHQSPEVLQVSLTDLAGKTLKGMDIPNPEVQFQGEWDITNLSAGIYFLIVETDLYQFHRKVMVR